MHGAAKPSVFKYYALNLARWLSCNERLFCVEVSSAVLEPPEIPSGYPMFSRKGAQQAVRARFGCS